MKPENRLSGGELWAILNIYSEKIAEYKKFKRDESKEGSVLNQFRRKSTTK